MRIRGITWKYNVTNDEVRNRTRMGNILNILRRNPWLWYVHRMSSNRLPKQALNGRPVVRICHNGGSYILSYPMLGVRGVTPGKFLKFYMHVGEF